MAGLSVIVASLGRPSLARTLASIAPQLEPGDELLVDVNHDQPWGNGARNRMIDKARRGNGLVFMDDDDVYAHDGLRVIRDAYASEPGSVHLFRMTYGNELIWREPVVREGNVSTQIVCVEAATAARFGDRYEGDFDFIEAACRDRPVRWHNHIVAYYRAAATPQDD